MSSVQLSPITAKATRPLSCLLAPTVHIAVGLEDAAQYAAISSRVAVHRLSGTRISVPRSQTPALDEVA